jgi:hypothetical protein
MATAANTFGRPAFGSLSMKSWTGRAPPGVR